MRLDRRGSRNGRGGQDMIIVLVAMFRLLYAQIRGDIEDRFSRRSK
jgi:hypothetical protein